MNSLQGSTVLAGLAVSDMDTAIGWYPDSRQMPQLADWNFAGNDTLQVVHDPERAGGSPVTLPVADIAAACDGVAGRGIELTVDDTASDTVRIGRIAGPDGNSVTLMEPTGGFDPQTSGGRA